MASRLLVGATLLLAVSAGCVAPLSGLSDDTTAALPTPRVPGAPLVQDHDHRDPALHEGLAYNAERVGFVTGWGDGTAFGTGGVNELALNGPYVFLGRDNPEGGFVVIDATDPAAPRLVSEWRAEGGADIEVTSDGSFVLFGSQRTTPGAQTPAHEEGPVPRGIYVVDVTDKSDPRFESFTPLPVNGPHTLTYHRLPEGRELVLVCTYDLNSFGGQLPAALPTSGTNPATQRVLIYEMAWEAGKRVLAPLSQWTLPPPAEGLTTWRPHDASVERHPVTGQLLAYVAYWDAGLVILDISDPSSPTMVSRFDDFSPSRLKLAHEARASPVLIDGMHVTAVAPEIAGTADETGQVTFLDTTDPANPRKLGHWRLPGDLVVTESLLFSPHNFEFDETGLFYIAHYHAGVWALDVSSAERLADPAAVAFYVPNVAHESNRFAGDVWSVRVRDDHLYMSDRGSGLHVVKLVDRPVPLLPAPGHLPGVAP